MPYQNTYLTAKSLDYRRLGKQRVECKQLLNALLNPNAKGWKNHPAARMWRGYELALCDYYNTIVKEWIHRGYRNNMPLINLDGLTIKYPPWWGNEDFHRSHRSNLIRKDAEFYGKQWPDEPADLPYVWPV